MVKDFDFDELDKAVTSVLNQNTDSQPAQAQPDNQPSADPSQVDQGPIEPSNDQPVSIPDHADQSGLDPVVSPAEPIQPINVPPVEPQPMINDPIDDTPLVSELVTDESNDGSADVPVETPAAAEPKPEPAVIEQPSIAKPTIPARRGRFMDMVHPSADMQSPAPTMRASRTGVNLAPSDSFGASVVNNDVTPQAVNPLSNFEPKSDDNEDVATTDSESTQFDNPITESQDDGDVAPVGDSTPVTEPVGQLEPVDPPHNPFIEGASDTIEKRPLGGYVSTDPEPEAAMSDEPVETDVTDETVSDSEAVAVESHEDQPEPVTDFKHVSDDTSAFSQTSEQASFAQQTTETTIETNEKVETEESVETTPEPTTAASSYSGGANPGPSPFITPQYKAAEEKADSEEHGVFDTSTYHQPLSPVEAPVAGKKHIIFWLILIVALFVGGGALGALYFLSLN